MAHSVFPKPSPKFEWSSNTFLQTQAPQKLSCCLVQVQREAVGSKPEVFCGSQC